MLQTVWRWLMPVALAAAVLSARAQTDARIAKPDPLDPKASVPALTYQSSFTTYKRVGQDGPVPWRDANDTVTRIGGWRVYAREAQQPASAPVAKPPQAVSPAETTKPLPTPQRQGHGGQKTP